MALTYCFLASGSSGNCLWVRGNGTEILVDCGISARAIRRGLDSLGHSLDHVHAVVCTHAHVDHVAGASVLARREDRDIWITAPGRDLIPGTAVPDERLHAFEPGATLELGGLKVESVPTSHDSPGSVAFVIDDGASRLGVVTDLGVATPEIARAIAGVDALVLEMNHDEEMLENGPYPYHLKRRIRSQWGHLSNREGAALLDSVLHAGLQHLTLAHLSEHNNVPDLARSAAEQVLEARAGATRLAIAAPRRPSAPVELKARRQLTLPLRA